MFNFNLGNFGGQLKLSDINGALSNSGSGFQFAGAPNDSNVVKRYSDGSQDEMDSDGVVRRYIPPGATGNPFSAQSSGSIFEQAKKSGVKLVGPDGRPSVAPGDKAQATDTEMPGDPGSQAHSEQDRIKSIADKARAENEARRQGQNKLSTVLGIVGSIYGGPMGGSIGSALGGMANGGRG